MTDFSGRSGTPYSGQRQAPPLPRRVARAVLPGAAQGHPRHCRPLCRRGRRDRGKSRSRGYRSTGSITTDKDRLKVLEELGENDQVKAVIVAINSPGGTTAGGEELYEALGKLRAKKPVVAVIDELGASAAYMTAIATDRIFARRLSIVGSIGVLFQTCQCRQAHGDHRRRLSTRWQSGPLKAEPDIDEPMTPEVRASLQSLVDDSFSLVRRYRRRAPRPDRAPRCCRWPMAASSPASRASNAKLIDAVGGEAEAIAWLESDKAHRRRSAGVDLFPAPERAGSTVGRWLGRRGACSASACRPKGRSRLTGWSRFGRLPADLTEHRLAFCDANARGAEMIKSELVEKLADENPHLFQRDIENIVNAILDEVGDAMARGDRVELRGFGAFSVKNRPARVGRNPRTGEQVDVGEKYVPQFKAGKEIRERLNQRLAAGIAQGTSSYDQTYRRLGRAGAALPGADRVCARQPPARRGQLQSVRARRGADHAGHRRAAVPRAVRRAAVRRGAGRHRHLVRPGPAPPRRARLPPRDRAAAPRSRSRAGARPVRRLPTCRRLRRSH